MEKLLNIIENIGIGVAMITPDMRVLELNEKMRDWFPEISLGEKLPCGHSSMDFHCKHSSGGCPAYPEVRRAAAHFGQSATAQSGV